MELRGKWLKSWMCFALSILSNYRQRASGSRQNSRSNLQTDGFVWQVSLENVRKVLCLGRLHFLQEPWWPKPTSISLIFLVWFWRWNFPWAFPQLTEYWTWSPCVQTTRYICQILPVDGWVSQGHTWYCQTFQPDRTQRTWILLGWTGGRLLANDMQVDLWLLRRF